MVYIKEIPEGENSIVIQVDGSLESEAMDVFKEVCERNLSKNKKVTLNLQHLFYISREGKEYLKEIKRQVVIVGS